MNFEFNRLFRTNTGEGFVVFSGKERIAHLSVHYDKVIYADLIIECNLSVSNYEKLIDCVYRIIDVDCDDILLSTWSGKEINSYSNTVDHSDFPPTRKEIAELKKLISVQSGKHGKAIGHLSEQAVKEYFEAKKYEILKTNDDQDREKIDFLAKKVNVVCPVQVKHGEMTSREMRKCVKSMLNFYQISNFIKEGCEIRPVFVSGKYQNSIGFSVVDLEIEFGVRIVIINMSDVLGVIKKYKYSVE